MTRPLTWSICIIVFSVSLYHSYSIPVVKSLGCGSPNDMLSIDRKTYCCIHFKLNCDSDILVQPSKIIKSTLDISKIQKAFTIPLAAGQQKKTAKTSQELEESVGKLLRVKNLGQNCESKWVRCGTGLECRLGVCVRDRSMKHFRRLVSVGKEVENAERMAENEDKQGGGNGGDGDNHDDGNDPLSNGDHLVIRGQSVDIDVTEQDFSHSQASTDLKADEPVIIIGTTKENKKKHNKENITDVGRLDKAAVHGDEEDEVTANIADYLASQGKTLTKTEWQTVRRLISGTLDERSEREEEVDQVDAVKSAAQLQMQKQRAENIDQKKCDA